MTKHQAMNELERFHANISEISHMLHKSGLISAMTQRQLRAAVNKANGQVRENLLKKAILASNERYGVRGKPVTAK